MELDALLKRYNRLKRELALAYEVVPWQSGRIDKVADALVHTERQIAACESHTVASRMRVPLGQLSARV
jgi:hypothetical protein